MFANPPYGERLMDIDEARKLYNLLGKTAGKSDLKQYYLTSDEEFEKHFGYIADKKRKLYNGMIKCDLYMYFKPDRKVKRLSRGQNSAVHKRNTKNSKKIY